MYRNYVYVSVPLRGCGFEIVHKEMEFSNIHEFPSPCGDVVLKYSTVSMHRRKLKLVSVPLRGCGFEIMSLRAASVRMKVVSVPLRGCGFEIWAYNKNVSYQLKSFRPLAGMWF